MKPIIAILSALLLMGSCSKETNCNSNNGTVEIYTDKYGGCSISGADGRFDLMLNAKSKTVIEKPTGKYYIAYYNNTSVLKKDSFDVKVCETVKLTY